MAVENFICESCLCANVCKIKSVLVKFDKDAKSPLPTDIQILASEDYQGSK